MKIGNAETNDLSRRNRPVLFMNHMKIINVGGFAAGRMIRDIVPHISRSIATAGGSVNAAVRTDIAGRNAFVGKPFKNEKSFFTAVRNAIA